jgi:transcriptional antiterminator NusG
VGRIKNKLKARASGIEFICPDEEVVLNRFSAERRTVRKMTLPGYVLVRGRRIQDRIFTDISRVTGVLGFLGGDKPVPLPHVEVSRILGGDGSAATVNGPTFEPQSQVHITSGPLDGFSGVVISANKTKRTAIVEVAIFGRATPTEVPFASLRRA